MSNAFPGSVHRSMLGVHLYFVKLFGCLITQNSIPIDISPFANAILNDQAHPKVWICFWVNAANPTIKHVGHSHVETAQVNGRIAFATWFYYVERVAVSIIYAEPTERRKGLVHAWHPSQLGKRVRIAHEA